MLRIFNGFWPTEKIYFWTKDCVVLVRSIPSSIPAASLLREIQSRGYYPRYDHPRVTCIQPGRMRTYFTQSIPQKQTLSLSSSLLPPLPRRPPLMAGCLSVLHAAQCAYDVTTTSIPFSCSPAQAEEFFWARDFLYFLEFLDCTMAAFDPYARVNIQCLNIY